MVLKQKQGISPVVATALLLVVAVVAVVGFQTWFQSFQSETLAKSSQAGAAGSEINFQLLTNESLFLTSSGYTGALTITVEGCSTDLTPTATNGLNDVSLSTGSCTGIDSGQIKSILVRTDANVYSFDGIVQ